MKYQDYRKKIEQRKKVKDFFYRFRFLISSALLVAVALFFTLFSIKGIVIDSKLLNGQTFSYGESLTEHYDSTSVFSSAVGYEFATRYSEDWSEIEPTHVGNYQMRAYSYNNYGQKYYGSIQYFTIEPKAVEAIISEDTTTYGDKPTVVIDGLIDGDSIQSYDISYENLFAGTTKAVATNLVIYNEDREDVTSDYDISLISKDITINNRTLVIETASEEKTYDGTALTNETYTFSEGSLADGDSLFFKGNSFPSLTKYGYCENTPLSDSVVITNKENVDVTSLYDISFIYGKLSVQRRYIKVTFEAENATVVYDGSDKTSEFHKGNIQIVDGSLASGDTIQVSFSGDNLQLIEPSSTQNEFEISIVNSNNEEVSSSYQIAYSYQYVTIAPIPLKVKINEISMYNDESFTYSLVDGTELLAGDNLSLTYTFMDDDDYTIQSKVYRESTNSDVSYCYDIDVIGSGEENALPSITKRKLYIVNDDVTKTYDGTALTLKAHLDSSRSDPLCLSDTIEFTATEVINATDGAIEYEGDYTIYDSNGEERDETYLETYYDITIEKGTYSIEPEQLTVTLKDQSKVYDSNAFYASYTILEEGSDYTLTSGKLYLDHSLNIVYVNLEKDLTTVGETTLTSSDFMTTVTNEAGEEVTKNYDVHFVDATITIEKRLIKIVPSQENMTKYYDKTAFSFNSESYTYTVEEPSIAGDGYYALLEGDELVYTLNEDLIEVGDYDLANYVTFQILRNGVDVTSNYALDIDYGQLSISKITVSISIEDVGDVVYGSEEYDVKYTASGYPSNYTCNVFFNKPTTDSDFGTYNITINDIQLYDSSTGLELRSANGDFDYVIAKSGTVNITKRSLNYKFVGNLLYDGSNHELSEVSLYSQDDLTGGLVGDDEISISTSEEIKEIGSYYFDNEDETALQLEYQVVDSLGNDHTDNYDISISGTVYVYQGNATVSLNAFEEEYLGNPISKAGTYTLDSEGDIYSEDYPFSISSNNPDYSRYHIEIDVSEPISTSDPTVFNYDISDVRFYDALKEEYIDKQYLNITTSGSTLTFLKHDLHVEFLGNNLFYYDKRAQDLSDLSFSITNTTWLLDGDELVYEYEGEMIDVGSYTCDNSDENCNFTYRIVHTEDGSDRTSLYNLTVTGNVDVIRGSIDISGTLSKGYDGTDFNVSGTYTYDSDHSDSLPSGMSVYFNVPLSWTSSVTFDVEGVVGAQEKSGTYSATVTSVTMVEEDGYIVPEECVDILNPYSDSMVIAEREIDLSFGSNRKLYDGEVADLTDLHLSSSQKDPDALADGDRIVYSFASNVKETNSNNTAKTYNLASTSYFQAKVYRGSQDVTDCYAIHISGTLTIARATISLDLDPTDSDSNVKIYDGTSLSLNEVIAGFLVNPYSYSNIQSAYYEFNVSTSASILTVKESPYTVTKTDFTYSLKRRAFDDDPERTIDNNYIDFNIANNKLVINVRDLVLNFGTTKKLFNGKTESFDSLSYTYTDEGDGLASGHSMLLTYTGNTIYSEATYLFNSSTVKVQIIDTKNDNKDVTENYNITIKGSYTIVVAEVKVSNQERNFIYDGESHQVTLSAYAINFSSTDWEIVITSNFSIFLPGTLLPSEENITSLTLTNITTGEVLTMDYIEIAQTDFRNVTMEKGKVTLTSNNKRLSLNGNYVTLKASSRRVEIMSSSIGGLVVEAVFEETTYYEAGVFENNPVSYTIYLNGVDVTSYLDITTSWGKITVS